MTAAGDTFVLQRMAQYQGKKKTDYVYTDNVWIRDYMSMCAFR